MRPALSRAAATAVAAAATVVLTAGPALANDPVGSKEGADPGKPLPLGTALLLYIGGPVLLFTIIASIVWLPGAVRSGRYRPAEGWGATPVWFAGPVDPKDAVAHAAAGDVVRGGASGSW